MEGERSSAADVVIIGGGFSGTMLAAQLARRGIGSTLIEGSGREGRGAAYSTTEEAHLLNVPAGWMSAWADRPSDFAEAVAGEGYGPEDYVPRRRYGDYLSGILRQAEASGRVAIVNSRAVAVEHSGAGWAVGLADGSRVEGDALVLAQGNQPPDTLDVARDVPPGLFVRDPWSDTGREAIAGVSASNGDVLIIGTGLTMVDVVLSLEEAGHRGRIVALSRRGLAPRSHAEFEPAPAAFSELPHESVGKLWSWLRRRGAEVGWRAAVDSIRPHSHALWQALGAREQRRFLRHARPWWDVHRHRIAPQVAGRIRQLVQEGRLEIMAGRIQGMTAGNQGLGVAIKRRGMAEARTRNFALAINCTGPLGSISHSGDQVLRSLFAAGLARPNSLNMGLEVDDRSRVAGAVRAWALGPLTKGRYWEIIAVPDIREQVSAAAEDISKELSNAVQS